MSAEQLVAAAAAATGPITNGDLAGWSEQVRRAASAAVVIAADMERLLEALADPDLKMHVRTVTGVEMDKGRFIISYKPPIVVMFQNKATEYSDFRTGWVEEPHARQIARTARDSVGAQCIFFQLNEKQEGSAEAPAAGYRRLVHLEPVPSSTRTRPVAPSEPAPPPAADSTSPERDRFEGHVRREVAPPVEEAPAEPERRESAPRPEPNAHAPLHTPVEEREQPTLSPTPPPVHDPRPLDPLYVDTVVVLLTEEEAKNPTLPIRKEVMDAYKMRWWGAGKAGDRQRIIRAANEAARAAGQAYVEKSSLLNPTTTGDLRIIGGLTRALVEHEMASV